MIKQEVIFEDLGRMDYQQAWSYQESLLQKNLLIKSARIRAESLANSKNDLKEETLPTTLTDQQTINYLLFVEHAPVYTLGKSGHMEHILIGENELKEKRVEFFRTNRGGDITFHGPGQLVVYPILDLEHFYTDIGKYLRSLEEVVILTLKDYEITAERSPGETGVWIDPDKPGSERKIAAIGVRCSRWITMHGFAFNINTDLSFFDHIIACGIHNKKVTSLQKELGFTIPEVEVKLKVKKNFEKVFGVGLRTDN